MKLSKNIKEIAFKFKYVIIIRHLNLISIKQIQSCFLFYLSDVQITLNSHLFCSEHTRHMVHPNKWGDDWLAPV